MAEPSKGLAERVEVFSRATSDALQKAVGEVLDARSPWQLLYRLSRIVLLGLVLYTAWLLITLQPELARRMRTTTAATLEQQVAARQGQVQALLRRPIATSGSALHTLVLLQWDGGGSARVLAAEGRHAQFGLLPAQVSLLGVELAEALGHVALGLCTSQQRAAPPLAAGANATAAADRMLFCPVRSGRSGQQGGVLLAIYAPPLPGQSQPSDAVADGEADAVAMQQQMLQLLAQQLADLLTSE